MDTMKKNTQVHGSAGFPAWTILFSFLVTMAGWALGNTFAGVIGMLGLLASVVSIEYLTLGSAAHTPKQRITSTSKVMHA